MGDSVGRRAMAYRASRERYYVHDGVNLVRSPSLSRVVAGHWRWYRRIKRVCDFWEGVIKKTRLVSRDLLQWRCWCRLNAIVQLIHVECPKAELDLQTGLLFIFGSSTTLNNMEVSPSPFNSTSNSASLMFLVARR